MADGDVMAAPRTGEVVSKAAPQRKMLNGTRRHQRSDRQWGAAFRARTLAAADWQLFYSLKANSREWLRSNN